MATIRFVEREQAQPFVYIVSSALASLPAPGNRVGTGDASNMPTIQASTGNSAIRTAAGAHHYRLVGLNIKAPATLLQDALVRIGGGETSLSQFPTDITLDRCLVQGDATVGVKRGVQMDGIRVAVIDSYLKDCKADKAFVAETQALWALNTPGPLKAVNNYLEASGENVMFGGDTQTITGLWPQDIELRRNYIYKQTAWTGSSSPEFAVKNHIELKTGSRVLIEGNVLENCPQDDQNGDSILVAPKDHSTWNRADDVTIRYNYFINCSQGILFAGKDLDGTLRASRVTVKHNFLDITGYGGSQRRMFTPVQNITSLEIEHNTGFINVTTAGATSFADSASDKMPGFVFRNNIFSSDFYGFAGSGTATGTPSLDGHFTGWTFTNNAMIGGSGYTYPENTWYPANTGAVGFVDFAGGDYSLTPGGTYAAGGANDATDNTDLGANITALNAAKLHSIDGQWGSEPPTYSDRTYTNAELPRTYIDTTYRAQTGNLWTVTSSSGGSVAGTGPGNRTDCSLAYALANCAIGDTISILYSLTITGSFTLRNI